MENTQTQPAVETVKRGDLHQQVTDTIIQQLEAGTVPWQRPWTGDDSPIFAIPQNFTTGKKYQGINIVLLWSSALNHNHTTCDWASFRQWQAKKETIRKGEKGSIVVYYDTFEKEVDGETKKIPFLKSSVVFNRCQLASYNPKETRPAHEILSLVEKVDAVEAFIENTGAEIAHIGSRACYLPKDDVIYMPDPDTFISTANSTATEAYYSTMMHELTHWTGSPKRLDRVKGKKFGDQNYAIEELTAELGAAFLSAEFDICSGEHADRAAYIASWLKALREDKRYIFTAAGEASKAVSYLQSLQP